MSGYSLPYYDDSKSINPSNFSRGGALTGFQNTENSCYINAILQALLSIPAFQHDLATQLNILSSPPNPNSFYSILHEISLQTQYTDHGVIEIKKLKDVVSDRYTRFTGNQQQDAHEFLSECLNYLNDDIKEAIRTQASVKSLNITNNNNNTNPTNNTGNNSPQSDNTNTSKSTPRSTRSKSIKATPTPPPSKSELELLGNDWPRYFSPSYKNFHCEIEYTLVCTNSSCCYTRQNFEHFHDFSLDIPETKNKPATATGTSTLTQGSPSPSPTLSPTPSPEPNPNTNAIPDLSLGASTGNNSNTNESRTLRSALRTNNNTQNNNNNNSNIPNTNTTSNNNPPSNSSPTPLNTSEAYNSSRPLCPIHKRPMHKVPSYQMYMCKVPGCKQAVAATIDPAGNYNVKRSKNTVGSLSGLLEQFFESRLLDLKCPKCNNSQVQVTARIRKLPRVLILHLKRFQPNWARGTYTKRSDRVFVDQLLDLSFACNNFTNNPLINYKDVFPREIDLNLLQSQIKMLKLQPDNNIETSNTNTIQQESKSNDNNPNNTSNNSGTNTNPVIIMDSDSDSSSIVSVDSDGEPIRDENNNLKPRRSKRNRINLQQQQQKDIEEKITVNTQTNNNNNNNKRTKLTNDPTLNSNMKSSGLKPIYCLQSIVQHRGAMAHYGHYVTDIKQNLVYNPQKNWLRYDDQFVKEIPAETALRQSESEGYIFFFVHQDLLQIDQLPDPNNINNNINSIPNNTINTTNFGTNAINTMHNNNLSYPSGNSPISTNSDSQNYSITMRNNNIVIANMNFHS